MIKLETAYYCHNCLYFVSAVNKTYDKEDGHTTIITCQDKDKCERFRYRLLEIEKAASINPDSCE